MLATGSVPREIGLAPTDGKAILNSDHILELERVPQSLIVLGAGAVGTEFASLFASFGSAVTLVEMLPRILPIEDEEVSTELERSLQEARPEGHGRHPVDRGREDRGRRQGDARQGRQGLAVEAEMLLVAVGRAPVTEGLGLEALGIKTERGYVAVDGACRPRCPASTPSATSSRRRGSPTSPRPRASWRSRTMAGDADARPLNYDRTPSCTYCEPEVGSVGLTEAKARSAATTSRSASSRFIALGKARILGKTAGFVKIVRDKKYDEMLGVHIIGPHATDLIAEACVALAVEIDDRGARPHHPRPPDPVRGGGGSGARGDRARHPHLVLGHTRRRPSASGLPPRTSAEPVARAHNRRPC